MGAGITHIKLLSKHRQQICLVARLTGLLDFFEVTKSSMKKHSPNKNKMNNFCPNPGARTHQASATNLPPSTRLTAMDGMSRRRKYFSDVIIEYFENLLGGSNFYGRGICFSDHVRANSETSHEEYEPLDLDDRSEIVLFWLHCTRAHQQPLTSLVIQSGIIVTGSQVTIGHNKYHNQE